MPTPANHLLEAMGPRQIHKGALIGAQPAAKQDDQLCQEAAAVPHLDAQGVELKCAA